MKNYILIIILVLLTNSCKNDTDYSCSDADLGDYCLLQDSKSKFPYSGEEQYCIFDDSLGNNIEFLASGIDSMYGKVQGFYSCPEDMSKKYSLFWSTDILSITFINFSLDISFSAELQISVTYSNKERILADVINVYNETYFNDHIMRLHDIVINKRKVLDGSQYDDYHNFHDSISILGDTYNNVYTDAFDISSSRLFFTKEKGIIAIRDKGNKLWKLNKMVYKDK